MPGLVERHLYLAVIVILFLEDLGIPTLVPADVVVVYAGYRVRQHGLNPAVLLLMVLTVNLAGVILFTVARRGGRPLVNRFGRFVGLNAEKLERTQGWLAHRGLFGIAVSRATPGARLLTVIACGIFQVPYRIFVPAQIIGTSIYLSALLALGYFLGPQAAERIHLPALSLRLVLLLLLVVALPLLLRRLNGRTATDNTRVILSRLRRMQRVSAAAVAGIMGMIELTSIWATIGALTDLALSPPQQHLLLAMLRRFDRDEPGHTLATILLLNFLALLGACIFGAIVFFEVLMRWLHMRVQYLGQQTLALMLWMLIVSAMVGLASGIHAWLVPSGAHAPITTEVEFLALLLGMLGYAYVAVEARRLLIDRLSTDPSIAPSAARAIG